MIEYENLQKVNARFEEAFKVKLKEFLTKGWYILGNEVSAFEKEFASFAEQNFVSALGTGLMHFY